MGNSAFGVPMIDDYSLSEFVLKLNASLQSGDLAEHEKVEKQRLLELLLRLSVFQLYFIPAAVCAGVIGNVLSAVVLLQTNISKHASSHYMAAKCLVDVAFLAWLILLWLRTLGWDLYAFGVLCHMMTFLTTSVNFLTTWLVVCLSVDRYLNICWPRCLANRFDCCLGSRQALNHQPQTSVLCARICIILLVILATAVFLNMSLIFGVFVDGGYRHCTPRPQFITTFQTLNKVDIFVNVLLPYSLIVAFNVLTLKSILKSYFSRRSVISNKGISGHSYVLFIPKQELCIARVALIFCLTFLLLTLPTQSLRLYHDFRQMIKVQHSFSVLEYMWQKTFQFAFYLSLSLNFPVLLFSYRAFRRSLRFLFVGAFLKLRVACRTRRTNQLPLNAMGFAVNFSTTLGRLNETSLV